ncbi:MAG: SDR family oxidoreductase [Clostridia bacterium]|nr:SDR family oxidoreductase [Clostridia bacterium]
MQDGVAIVAGGTGGLGRVIVAALLGEGWRVAVPYRRETGAEQLQQRHPDAGDRLWLMRADLAREDEVARFVSRLEERWGRVDALVNAVGDYVEGPRIDATPLDTWRYMMQVNLDIAFLTARAVLPVMRRQKRGAIVLIASLEAARSSQGVGAYAVSKAALVKLSDILAAEGKPDHITCNVLLPGIIDTEETRRAGVDGSRWVPASDIARLVLHLCSPAGGSISGAHITFFGPAR